MKSVLEQLQPLGRALMLPIAVLPVAGLLLRLGQPDLLDVALLSAAGEAIFSHLGLLFAIGVATGFARDGNGAACLAGVACYLISTQGAQALMTVPADAIKDFTGPAAELATAAWKTKAVGRLDVPIGIVSGLIGGSFYNRFSSIKLPEYLAFFGGRRFVPIVSGLAGLVLGAAIGLGFAVISDAIDSLSYAVAGAGGIGLFIYGVLNRLLLVTGLHHILNNIAWFVVGDFHGTTGDLRRFFAGDPEAGAFMAGFFPVMMFGLPAACLAMYHAALPERRKAVGGMLLSLALTAALTGVTEPIEFTFMFLAPVLYAIHAVLTGLSMVIMDTLGVKLGFGFSAGLFDYVLNFNKSTRPLMLLPVGAAYFVIYYSLFRFVIKWLDLPTPGRERDDSTATADVPANERGGAFVAALGGAANLTSVDACTTRLRLIVADQGAVDEPALKALGSRGVIRPSVNAIQIVLGPIADAVAMDIRDAIAGNGAAKQPPVSGKQADRAHDILPLSAMALSALGGAQNVVTASLHGNRIRIVLKEGGSVVADTLYALGGKAVVHPTANILHILIGSEDGSGGAFMDASRSS